MRWYLGGCSADAAVILTTALPSAISTLVWCDSGIQARCNLQPAQVFVALACGIVAAFGLSGDADIMKNVPWTYVKKDGDYGGQLRIVITSRVCQS